MKKVLIALILLFGIVNSAVAATKTFYIDNGYDADNRRAAQFQLVHTSQKAYFYVEADYLNQLNGDKSDYINAIKYLGNEFDNAIYPKLTSYYGDIPMPGVDNNPRVYFVFHRMKDSTAGYFREKDSFDKLQFPGSNQKETVYLNAEYVTSNSINSYLSHEFTHLITFSQKSLELKSPEDVWLSEMISEYSPTFMGYDKGDNNYLERRAIYFFENPSYSIVMWKNTNGSYCADSMFAKYIGERYNGGIFKKVMTQKEVGIYGFDKAIRWTDKTQTFTKLFVDWSIANYLNDCNISERYCYKTDWLRNYTVYPILNVLTSKAKSSVNIDDVVPNWGAKWYKIVGGAGDLTVNITGQPGYQMSVPYVLRSKSGKYKVNYIDMVNNSGSLTIKNFSEEYQNIVLIPSYHDYRSVSSLPLKWSAQSSGTPETAQLKRIPDIVFLRLILQYLLRVYPN